MLLCPKCGERTNVYDTRISFEGKTRRKRICPSCSHRYSTIEVLDTNRVLKVRKPKTVVAKKVQPSGKSKVVPPKKQGEQKVKKYDDDERSYEDSFADDFADVVRELGIGDRHEYD